MYRMCLESQIPNDTFNKSPVEDTGISLYYCENWLEKNQTFILPLLYWLPYHRVPNSRQGEVLLFINIPVNSQKVQKKFQN